MRLVARWILVSLALLAVVTALVGLAFAGSSARIAEGVHIAGVDVSGLTQKEAQALLESRFERVARVPIVFTAGGEEYPIKATTLGVEADWATAIDSAARVGEGFGPVRGFKRLQTRFFGSEIAPPVQVYEAALDFKLATLAREIDRRHVEAKLVRRGLSVEIVAGQSGQSLAQDLAAGRVVRALARLERGQPIALPVRLDPVEVTATDLAPAAAQARIALSAPVRLEYEGTRWKLPRWRIAELLSLPVAGATGVAIAGPGAEAWFAKLRKTVERPPADATFRPVGDGIEVVAAKDGLAVDVPATAKALLAAAVAPAERTAALVVRTAEAELTTAEAQAMGIERRLASYTTLYAGTPDRITNLQLGVSLLNGALVAPGATFSFNDRVGERTIERGFRPAPVIIKDEYEEDVGGGVSQVATTTFNAAWEAGLKIAERNPHSLYISRYQLGRDATVNYPDLDLKFINDTPKWVFVAGAVRRCRHHRLDLRRRPRAARRERDGLDPGDRTGADPAGQGSDPAEGPDGDRGVGLAGARHGRHAHRLRRAGRGPARRDLEHVLPRRVPDHPRRHEAAAEARAEGEAQGREAGAAGSDRDGADDYDSALATASTEGGGEPDRPARRRVDRRVRCRTLGDERSLPLDGVLVAEARAAQVDAARPDPQPVVEVGGAVVTDVHLGRQRLDPLLLDRPVAARVLGQPADARDLEPDDEGRVVRDPLRIRLREADDDVGREVVALHCWRKISIRGSGCSSRETLKGPLRGPKGAAEPLARLRPCEPFARREPCGSRCRPSARPRTGSRRAGGARARPRPCARAAGRLACWCCWVPSHLSR